MKRILVAYGETSRMAKLHGCTLQTVRNALRGFVESELADRIRAEALRAGGIEKPKRRVIKETVSETE
ncbi:MAG: ArsR family transcriptional regulator [Prevotellaceae bacterium]|nr:ArsR family transcriptional regulator [Prevotellaceae bacterium]